MIPILKLDKIRAKIKFEEIIRLHDIEIEAILTKEVVKTNETGAKINFSRTHLGKQVIVLVPKQTRKKLKKRK